MPQVGMSFYVCFQNLALFQIRISPFPKFKIDTKENGNFIFILQHFHFGVWGRLFKFVSTKKSQEQAVSVFDLCSS